MLSITDHPDGIVISVRAKPGAKRTEILGEHAGALKVAVAAAPENGKANEALIEFLSDTFDCRRSQIEILRGETSRQKLVLLRGVIRAEVESVLGTKEPRTQRGLCPQPNGEE